VGLVKEEMIPMETLQPKKPINLETEPWEKFMIGLVPAITDMTS